METFVIVAYCASDDARKKLGMKDNVQTNVGVAQIMTTALVAARFFGGNHSLAQKFLYEHRYFHYKLSASQFNRRFHRVHQGFYDELMRLFGDYAKMANESFEFAIDSFPVQACDNIRIQRNKLFDPKHYRGMSASKRRYFFGVRVHMIATINRLPVEFKILPGGINDARGARMLDFNLPQGSIVYGDKAYGDYKLEDNLMNSKYIELAAIRKKNSTRMRSPCNELFVRKQRKPIETLFSAINRFIPKNIHAVTAKGFIKKVFCFVLAYCTSKFQVTT